MVSGERAPMRRNSQKHTYVFGIGIVLPAQIVTVRPLHGVDDPLRDAICGAEMPIGDLRVGTKDAETGETSKKPTSHYKYRLSVGLITDLSGLSITQGFGPVLAFLVPYVPFLFQNTYFRFGMACFGSDMVEGRQVASPTRDW